MLQSVIKEFSLKESNVIAMFPYGSRVYGTNSFYSDYDFIAIISGTETQDSLQSSCHNYNLSIYSEESFKDQINRHKIAALECIFLPEDLCLKRQSNFDFKFSFKLNKSILIESISEKSSHSWVKAKKKFEVEKDRDIYIAKKSLFHSLRIIDFGMQIAKHNKIIDYTSAHYLWSEIYEDKEENWQHYKNKWQPKYNAMMSLFRMQAPK
jgi:predicted nucleotidyltransferase